MQHGGERGSRCRRRLQAGVETLVQGNTQDRPQTTLNGQVGQVWREGRRHGRRRRQRRRGHALRKQPHDHGAPLGLPLLQQAHVGAHGADERRRRPRKGREDVRAGKVRARV